MVPSLGHGARSRRTSVPQWSPGGVRQVPFCSKGLGRSVHFPCLQKCDPLQEFLKLRLKRSLLKDAKR